MKASDIPNRINLPFANSGSKNTIPTASQIGITDGAASLTDGFPPLTFLPIASGGTGPAGEDFNGILYEITANTRWDNAGGLRTFNSTFSTAIGGYPQGSVLARADATGFWVSLIDDNTEDPDTGTNKHWFAVNNFGITSVSLTNSNVALTPAQYAKEIIDFTGTLTGNVEVTFPAIAGSSWIISNSTTGAFSLTCKTSGTGFILAQGVTTSAYTRGTNLDQVTLATGISQAFADARYVLSGADGLGNNVVTFSVNGTLTVAQSGTSVKSSKAGSLALTVPTTAAGLNYHLMHNQTYDIVLSGGDFRDMNGVITSTFTLLAGNRITTIFCDGVYWRIDRHIGQIGYEQTWQDMTSLRAAGSTYTNTTPRPIMVSVRNSLTSAMRLFVDGVDVANCFGASGTNGTMVTIVPPGSTYHTDGGALAYWAELR